ncbi:hypothetical protein WG66_004155, partial [Moniliophthora roreri]
CTLWYTQRIYSLICTSSQATSKSYIGITTLYHNTLLEVYNVADTLTGSKAMTVVLATQMWIGGWIEVISYSPSYHHYCPESST